MKAHKSIVDGLNIDSCDMTRSINHHNIAYADDNDGHATADKSTHQEQAAHEAVSRLRSSAQHWSNLTSLARGYIALHKWNWQLIAWEFLNGELFLVKATKKQLILENGKGLHSMIEFIRPNTPNIGLGFRLYPDGNQAQQYEHTISTICSLCKRLSYLSEVEGRKAGTIPAPDTKAVLPTSSHQPHQEGMQII